MTLFKKGNVAHLLIGLCSCHLLQTRPSSKRQILCKIYVQYLRMQKLLSKASDFFLDKESDDFATWKKLGKKRLKKKVSIYTKLSCINFSIHKDKLTPIKNTVCNLNHPFNPPSFCLLCTIQISPPNSYCT